MVLRLLLIAALVLGAIWLLHRIRAQPPERARRLMRNVAIWGLVSILLLAVLTGRLNPLLAAVGAAIPLLLRVANLLRLIPVLRQIAQALGLASRVGEGAAAGSGQRSTIRTRYLDMVLDHGTGELAGQVLDGPFKGRSLGSLQLDELLRMRELYEDSDPQSLAVLEAYLDRERDKDWRDKARASRSGSAAERSGELTEGEARSILGVEPGADAAAIRAAHRRLMQRLHPDRGGSDYLAAKINQAKHRLLGD